MKRKLRPSQDVLQRLRWDPRFDAGAYLVVYRERGGGTKQLAVPSFLEDARIPWSRVVAVVHRDGRRVWDREARIDRLFGSGETDPDELLVPGADGGEGFGIALDPWRCEGGEWRREQTPPAPVSARPLRVVTWNLLFDRFEPERVQSARRLPEQLRILREADADLIALQEVTPGFYEALLSEPWVQTYWASEGPEGKTLDPHGQAILSRVPLQSVRVHAYSARKQVVLATLETSEGRLVVANLHLTSNQTERADEVRLEQLRTLTKQLTRAHPDDDWLLLGDFNQGEDEPDGGLERAGARDLWPELEEGPGHTYVPAENALAGHFSAGGAARRFDRVYLRSTGDRWRGVGARLLARDAIPATDPELWPSDHFALAVDLSPGDGLRGEPVVTSALALVPPAALWEPIQTLRREHDDRVSRWPPHVTLLFGFVAAGRFPAAARRLRALLADQAPPALELARVEVFSRKRDVVFWAAPTPDAALQQLWTRVSAPFPLCAGTPSASGKEQGRLGYTPHLTLGRRPKGGPTRPTQEAWAAALGALSWTPDAVFLLAREGREPFHVRAAVPIGPPRTLEATLRDTGLLPDEALLAARARARDAIEACCAARGARAALPVGSEALGVALATSDLDLYVQAEDADTWREELVASLRESPELAPDLRVLRAEPAPAGEGEVARVTVAAGAARVRFDLQVGEGDVHHGRREAELALASPDLEAFRAGLRALRVWARLRDLDRQAFGGLGGVAWAAIASAVWRDLPERTPGALLRGVLARLVAGGPDLSSPARAGASGAPRVSSLSDTERDLASGLRPSAWLTLRAEARRALPVAEAALVGEGAWSGLFLPLGPPAAPRVSISLNVSRHEPAPRSAAEGWAAGIAQELLRRIEEGGARPRFYATPVAEELGGRLRLEWWIGLSGALADASWERITRWLDRAARHAPGDVRYELEG